MQREAERKAALRQRAEAHRQEALRAQVRLLCKNLWSILSAVLSSYKENLVLSVSCYSQCLGCVIP